VRITICEFWASASGVLALDLETVSMFEGFSLETIAVSQGRLRVRHGGSGPPLLLLHGHPRTHMTWGRVADRLSSRFTVVCPDLRGFGQSFSPVDTPDHSGSSKRAKAQDCIELMELLGHRRVSIAGHDRGCYVAFRAALDHPERIERRCHGRCADPRSAGTCQ
jgi:haloacetate dehalogenase